MIETEDQIQEMENQDLEDQEDQEIEMEDQIQEMEDQDQEIVIDQENQEDQEDQEEILKELKLIPQKLINMKFLEINQMKD